MTDQPDRRGEDLDAETAAIPDAADAAELDQDTETALDEDTEAAVADDPDAVLYESGAVSPRPEESADPPVDADAADVADPDLRAARTAREDAGVTMDELRTEELRPESEQLEYEPPDRPSTPTERGYTAADEERGETLDERLAEEEDDDTG